MKTVTATATTLLSCLLPLSLNAQALPLTVEQMQRACDRIVAQDGEITAENAISVGACFGAIRGVVQVMQANCRSFGAGQFPAPALSIGEIPDSAAAIAAFKKWAEANPDEADAPAEYGLIVAFSEAFPCQPAVPRASPQPQPQTDEQEQAPEAGQEEQQEAAEEGVTGD